jgi:hypothetical protein
MEVSDLAIGWLLPLALMDLATKRAAKSTTDASNVEAIWGRCFGNY